MVLGSDFFDLDHRQFLPMSDGFVIAFAALHLKGNLLIAANVFDHIRNDGCLRDGRRTDAESALIVDQQHAIESDRLPGLNSQPLDLESITRANAVLLAACF